jgi:apolipoprotein N-acyltransferase
MFQRLLLALVAGIVSGSLLALAFPPADLGWIAFLSLVPLFWLIRYGTLKEIAAGSAAFGLVFFGLLLYWILLFGTAAFLALILSQTAWVVVAMVTAWILKEQLPEGSTFISFPLAFVAGEYLRGLFPFGGFTWGGLGYSQHENFGILPLASYTGVWGLALVVAAVNALVGEGLVRVRRDPAPALALFVAAVAPVVLPLFVPTSEPDGATVRIAMVQGNTSEGTSDPRADDLKVLENHIRLTQEIQPGDVALALWPESSFDTNPLAEPSFREMLLETIRRANVPFLVGATIEVGEDRFFNTSLFFQADGNLAGRYEKMHLVPMGEYVPARGLLAPVFEQLERVPRDGIPGKEPKVFEIPAGRFASVICYENTFPSLVRSFVNRGGRFLVVSTNNSSYGRTAASEQHVAFSQVRAAEHRMWVAHVALTGISAVIAPDGEVRERTELFEPALLSPNIRFATGTTFYAQWGDWLPISALIVVIGVALLALVRWTLVARR